MKRMLAARQARAIVTRNLQGFAGQMPAFRVSYASDISLVFDARIERGAKGFDLVFSDIVASRSHRRSANQARRIAAMLYWLLQAPDDVKVMPVHLSDGDHLSAGGFLFSSMNASDTLVPDYYFYRQRGFPDMRDAAAASDKRWADRSETLVWRGGANGNGYVNAFPALAAHPATQQRIRCAWLCRDLGIDFGFIADPSSETGSQLSQAGLLGNPVPATNWLGMKYALDLDGFSNTWDNLFHRLIMGCCVLKVAGDFGFRQWYYDRLIPWQHFVPVRADMSDLAERLAWVRENDGRAREIASEGQALARSLTFESEAAAAGLVIAENWESYL